MIYGYFLQPCFSLKVWFNNRSNMKLGLLVILIVCVLPFLHKDIETSDHDEHDEAIRSCSIHDLFFTFDYLDTCENIQSFGTQLTINHFSISKREYRNLNSFSQFLLLLSGNISLNQAPFFKLRCNIRMNGTFLRIEVYISCT